MVAIATASSSTMFLVQLCKRHISVCRAQQPENQIEKEEQVSLSDAAIDAEWKRIQKKTFTRWCNEHLKKQGPQYTISEIGEDFSDGISMIVLLEVLSQKKVGRYNKKPRVHAQKMENLQQALDFITKKENIYLVNIGEQVNNMEGILSIAVIYQCLC